MGATGNRQGTFKFLDLDTKMIIKRKQFTEYPTPASIIKKVEARVSRTSKMGV